MPHLAASWQLLALSNELRVPLYAMVGSVLELLAAEPDAALEVEAAAGLVREGPVLDVVAVVEPLRGDTGAAVDEDGEGLAVDAVAAAEVELLQRGLVHVHHLQRVRGYLEAAGERHPAQLGGEEAAPLAPGQAGEAGAQVREQVVGHEPGNISKTSVNIAGTVARTTLQAASKLTQEN